MADVPSKRSRADVSLGIVLPDLSSLNERGQLVVKHGPGRVIETLLDRWPIARLCLPRLERCEPHFDYPVSVPSERITFLPPLGTTLSSQRYLFATRRILQAFAQNSDALFIKIPFQLPTCLRHLGRPKVVQVAGNQVEVVRASGDYRGVWRAMAVGYATYSHAVIRRLLREPQTRAVTHGRELWNELECQSGRVVVSSSLRANELGPLNRFSFHSPTRILFVGYLRPEKGLDVLLKAVARLRQQHDVELTIVGSPDRKTSAANLEARIQQLNLESAVHCVGLVPFGSELFEIYRNHDILVVPSLSEGTPRTLIEARAFGCVVVASRVGGIPDSVNDGVDGLLVPPGDDESLASAIGGLIRQPERQGSLIRAGFERVSNITVEAFVDAISEEIDLAIAGT